MRKITKQNFICDKCGKELEYTTENEYDKGFDFAYNECWSFRPNHHRAGYGSRFDGSEIILDLCDNCLYEFVDTFKFKNRIMDTGSNCGRFSNTDDESN